MTSHDKTKPVEHEIYPRRFYDTSPTWFAWNKLTAHGFHELKEEPGFHGQKVLFHLNHPIQFVSLTGLATQIELGGGAAAAKYCFLLLDDGSGKLVNVKIRRRIPSEHSAMEFLPTNTTVDNLNVSVRFGLPTLFIDKKQLLVGQCVRVRGSFDTYRERRQLDLKRIKIVESTTDEMKSWQETVRWHHEVLSKPWILTAAEREKFDADLEAQQKRDEDHRTRKRAWHARKAAKQAAADHKAECKLETLQAHFNDGALPGSEVIKAPWD